MAGDFSRKLFDKKKHYSGVLKQQGRVDLDADSNEQLDIATYRTHTETKDVIGLCGVPKKDNSFQISAPNGSNVNITPGRVYVSGLLCELEDNATYFNQPYFPNADNQYFNVPLLSPPASPLSPPTSPLSPPASPLSPVNANLLNGTYIVYIDAWQREVNFLDDPLLHEVALGEPDTTTRLQTVWQVKLLAVDNPAATCKSNFTEWNNLIASPTGKLNVRTQKVDDPKDPCSLPPQAGYKSLENQLYRVEVHKGGSLNSTMFKWSRENASVEALITKITGSVVTVDSTGKDEMLSFANGNWVEIVDEESSLKSTPRALIKINVVDTAKREITLDAGPGELPSAMNKKLKLRRWDQTVVTANKDGLPASSTWLDLEDGVQVMFSAGTYRAGDYWLIPARTATGEVEWPPYEIPNLSPIEQLPLGVKHYYCKLALLQVVNGNITVQDCRPKFPSLTEICAEDICFNNTNCNFPTVNNVQEAIDQLCQRTGGGSCTIIVKPGAGWESAFSNLKDGMDAQICFQAGTFPLSRKLIIQKKGNLKLVGSGQGSRIISSNDEAALHFAECKAIDIDYLYAEGGIATADDRKPRLNGVFTFSECDAVNIARTTIKSGQSDTRNCTCITVQNTPVVRIEDCDLLIGDSQQGILVINKRRTAGAALTPRTSNCWIERNNIQTYAKSLRGLTKRDQAGIRKLLLSNLKYGKRVAADKENNIELASGDFTVNFKSDAFTKDDWVKAMERQPKATSVKELHRRVDTFVRKAVTDKTTQARFERLVQLVKITAAQSRAISTQAITVGGELSNNLYIKDNVIKDTLQGIHVGLSHRAKATDAPDAASNVSICGNSIAVTLQQTVGKQDRYGIFAGNCHNILIENNTLTLERLNTKDTTAIDGIRVWGFLGLRMIIAQNLLSGFDGKPQNNFTIGIRVKPLNAPNQRLPGMQWFVTRNIAPGKIKTVLLLPNNNNGVILSGNTP